MVFSSTKIKTEEDFFFLIKAEVLREYAKVDMHILENEQSMSLLEWIP